MGKFMDQVRTLAVSARKGAERSLSRQFAHGVSVSEITLAVQPAEESYVISATYFLRAAETGDRRPLGIDLKECPLSLLTLSCNVATVSTSNVGERHRSFASLHLVPGACWNDAIITVRARWKPSELTSVGPAIYLMAPAFLPQTFSLRRAHESVETIEQPVVRLAGALPASVVLGYVSAEATAVSGVQGYCQMILCATNARMQIAESSVDNVVLASMLGAKLSSAQLTRTINIVSKARNFLAGQYSLAPDARLIVGVNDSESVFLPLGACVVAPPIWFGVEGADTSPAFVSIARLISGMWWGAGCFISGDHSSTISTGIGAALGLRWAEVSGDLKNRDAILASYQRTAARLPSIGPGRSPQGSRDLHFSEVALALYERLGRDDRALNALRELTRKQWGKLVAEATVRRIIDV